MNRTSRQSKALHTYFELVARELNEKRLSQRMLLDRLKSIDVPNSKESIKDLWRAVQMRYIGKKSTTNLTGEDIDKIYDALNKALAERLEIHVPFPDLSIIQSNAKKTT